MLEYQHGSCENTSKSGDGGVIATVTISQKDINSMERSTCIYTVHAYKAQCVCLISARYVIGVWVSI